MTANIQRLRFAARRETKEQAQLVRIKNLMLTMLGLWIFYFLVIHVYIRALNKIIVPILGLSLGVYLPIQGALIVFAVMLFWFSRKLELTEFQWFARKRRSRRNTSAR